MKLYTLPVVLRQPSEETEDQFLAEVPVLPGCRAWGDSAAQALENLQSVAAAFIMSYRERGDTLPTEVERAAREVAGSGILTEMPVVL